MTPMRTFEWRRLTRYRVNTTTLAWDLWSQLLSRCWATLSSRFWNWMCWCNLIWFFVLNGPCLHQKTTFFEQQRHRAALDLFDIWILNQKSQSAHIWLNFLRNSFWQWFNVWVPLELSFESLKTLWLFPDYHIKLADVYHPRKDFLPIKLSSKKSI